MGVLLLLPLSLIAEGQAWVINGDSLGCADLSTGTVSQGVLELAAYPNDLLLHGDYLYAVCSGSDDQTLQRVDPATLEITDLSIGEGYNCWAAVSVDDSHLAVSAALADKVVIVDTDTFQIEVEIDGVGPKPEGMCLLGDSLWVACGGWGSDNNLVVVDMALQSPVDTVEVGLNCQAVAWDNTDELVVVCSGSYGSGEGSMSFVDPQTMQETESVAVGGFPSTLQIRGTSAYAGDGWGPGVYEVDVQTHQVLHDWSDPLCPGGSGLALDSQGALYVSDPLGCWLSAYDPSMGQLAQYGFSSPGAVAVSGFITGIAGAGPAAPSEISVEPCPAATVAMVRGAEPQREVRVVDLTGRLVDRIRTDGAGEASLDLSGLDSGIYLIHGRNSSARLVVLRSR